MCYKSLKRSAIAPLFFFFVLRESVSVFTWSICDGLPALHNEIGIKCPVAYTNVDHKELQVKQLRIPVYV